MLGPNPARGQEDGVGGRLQCANPSLINKGVPWMGNHFQDRTSQASWELGAAGTGLLGVGSKESEKPVRFPARNEKDKEHELSSVHSG